jgi:hypothetical protein
MGEWLLDAAPAAAAMAHAIKDMKVQSTFTTQEVINLTSVVQDATRAVLERAKEGPEASAKGASLAGEGPSPKGPKRTLTPPSSNTGGKVAKGGKKSSRGRS